MTDEQQIDIARSSLYHFFVPPSTICEADDGLAYYFIVLRGSVTLEERVVSMHEGLNTNDASRKVVPDHDRTHAPIQSHRFPRGWNHRVLVSQVERSTTELRQHTIAAGQGFHHFPFAMMDSKYGYNARVIDPQGASVMLVPKPEYLSSLRRCVRARASGSATAAPTLTHVLPSLSACVQLAAALVAPAQLNRA